MNLSFVKSFAGGPAAYRQDTLVVYTHQGLAVLDPETLETRHTFHDFFHPDTLQVSFDGTKVLALHGFYGVRLYDIRSHRVLGDMPFPSGFHESDGSATFSFDGSEVMVLFSLASTPGPVGMERGERNSLFFCRRYDISDLDHPVDIPLTEKIFRLVPYPDGYLAISTDGTLYRLADDQFTKIETMRKMPVPEGTVLYYESKGWFYVQDATGFRVYDNRFEEINRIAITTAKASNPLPERLSLHDGLEQELGFLTFRVANIFDAGFLDDKILVHTEDALSDTQHLTAFDLVTGAEKGSTILVGAMEGLHFLGHRIGFGFESEYLIAEVD